MQAPEASPQATSRPSPPHIAPTTMIKTTDQPLVAGQPGQQQPMVSYLYKIFYNLNFFDQ